MVFEVPSSQEDESCNTIELMNASPRGLTDSDAAGGNDKNNHNATAKTQTNNATTAQPLGGSNRRVPSQKQSSKKEKIYHFFLPLGATLSGALLYKPSKVASLDFQLPFRLKGMPTSEPYPVVIYPPYPTLFTHFPTHPLSNSLTPPPTHPLTHLLTNPLTPTNRHAYL